MRIFVYEYICGGGLAGRPLPESLRREGWAMLRAVVEDFARCPGVEVVTLLDPRFAEAAPELEATGIDLVESATEARLYAERTRDADFTLVVAPEFDFLLYQRCCWTEDAGGRLLGPAPSAVRLTGDKLLLGQFWRRHGVQTPSELDQFHFWDLEYPQVCKPRRGAGSQGIFLVHDFAELHKLPEVLRSQGMSSLESMRNGFILEQFVRGQPASVGVLIGGGWRLALPAATQDLSDDGRFRYLGGSLPLPDNLNDRAQQLALRAIAPVDGLSGYVGVDLILGDAPDGSEDFAIEINPRLTTSYVGLRRLCNFNLAETMLLMALGRALPKRSYRKGIVRFQADGTVSGPEIQ